MTERKFSIDKRKLRMGMVGGGEGSFIGPVHRRAALMDEQIELVCGAFDLFPEKGRAYGIEKLLLDPARSYGTYQEMAEKEASQSPSTRMDFVVIVTPNHMHFPIAKTFLEAGFHIVCEKPMTTSLEQALELKELVNKTGRVFMLAHNYTGYQMVKQAKAMVAAGELGEIKKVVVQYPQGWLLTRLELEGLPQAVWRTDPGQSGPAGCLGDIGTHAANLVHYITGLEIEFLCADLTTFAPGRKLDDDVSMLLRYEGGARGILQSSQILAGKENDFNIWIHGDKASLHWRQEDPNYLYFCPPKQPVQILSRGNEYLAPLSKLASRVPPGHHEGYIESFANLYMGLVADIREAEKGEVSKEKIDYPGVKDGVRGMAFIETVLESHRSREKWTPFKKF